MKIPEHDETEELINLANNLEVMRLVHNLPRKIIKLLCYSLKREYEMRVARDKRINGLILEVDRQRGLYRASVVAKNATTETVLKAVIVKEIDGYIDLYKNQDKVSRSHVLKGLSELRNRINKKGE